jgi:hypothetical protein
MADFARIRGSTTAVAILSKADWCDAQRDFQVVPEADFAIPLG